MAHTPLGVPVAWRTRTNTAALYTFPVGRTSYVRQSYEWQPTFAVAAAGSGAWDMDTYGRQPVPVRVKPELDCHLRAGVGLSGSAAQQDVEDRFNALYGALAADYVDASDGHTYAGNVGYLRVLGADGTTLYDALARVLALPYRTTPGQNVSHLATTPQWQLLSDWTAVTAGTDADAPSPVSGTVPYLPLGQVTAWRDAADTADLSTFIGTRTTMLRGDVTWAPPFGKPPPGRLYETNLLGETAAPLSSDAEWDYLVKAGPGLSGAAAIADVESQVGTLQSALWPAANPAGSLGVLVVKSSDGTRAYKALARVSVLPVPMTPRTSYGLIVTMKARLLTTFTIGSPLPVGRGLWGTFVWGVDPWGG